MASNEAKVPAVEYADDKRNPEEFVVILVDIPRLKKKSFSREASNGTIDFKADTRSFSLNVYVEHAGKRDWYRYAIKQLPGDINPERCSCKVRKNEEIAITLNKVKRASWAGILSRDGLETAQ